MTSYYAMIFDLVDERTLRVEKCNSREDAVEKAKRFQEFIEDKRSWLIDRWRAQVMEVEE